MNIYNVLLNKFIYIKLFELKKIKIIKKIKTNFNCLFFLFIHFFY